MGAKILIADDESDIVSMLGSFFESKGFRVLPAFNGAEALKQVEKQPDIILLDINMPGKDGLEVCKRIRDHISCPILFLTARIEDTDKVKGFTVGGDDYIVKPFSLMELEARVRAHLRREARHNFEAQVKFSGDLTIDYSERCLFFGDKRVGLAKKEFDIVELLSQNPGQVFDKERIYERIWGYDSEGDSSVVAEHIRRIRTKIAAYTDRVYIETVWGCGYFGNPQEITSEINGQVWECTVPTAYAEKYAASYNTSNLRNTSENQTILRIVGDRPPMENAVRVQPTLEDLYLFYFKGGCEE